MAAIQWHSLSVPHARMPRMNALFRSFLSHTSPLFALVCVSQNPMYPGMANPMYGGMTGMYTPQPQSVSVNVRIG